jgi:hypothetical protein
MHALTTRSTTSATDTKHDARNENLTQQQQLDFVVHLGFGALQFIANFGVPLLRLGVLRRASHHTVRHANLKPRRRHTQENTPSAPKPTQTPTNTTYSWFAANLQTPHNRRTTSMRAATQIVQATDPGGALQPATKFSCHTILASVNTDHSNFSNHSKRFFTQSAPYSTLSRDSL